MNCDNIQGGIKAHITPLDMINARAYAKNRLLKEKVQAYINTHTQQGQQPPIIWKEKFDKPPYPCPQELKGTCFYGNAIINTRSECEAKSQLPYDDSSDIGMELTKLSTSAPYLEWKIDKKGGVEPKCYYSDPTFRKFCEKPKARSQILRTVDEFTKELENDPPFQYCISGKENSEECKCPPGSPESCFLEKIGQCKITRDFCESKRLNYNGDGCDLPEAAKVLKFFVGDTLARMMASEGWNSLNPIAIGQDVFNCVSDKRYKDKVKLIAKDYAGKNINLYMFLYKPEIKKMHPEYPELNIGFLADEIEVYYPKLITVKNNIKYINIDPKNINDRNSYKIYKTLITKDSILKLYLEFIKSILNKNGK